MNGYIVTRVQIWVITHYVSVTDGKKNMAATSLSCLFFVLFPVKYGNKKALLVNEVINMFDT